MSKRSTPFARVKQADAARKAKTWLLPMNRQDADGVSMRYHAALAALHNQQGNTYHLQFLLQMVIMTGFIGEAYESPIRPEVLSAAKQYILAAVTRARDAGTWTLDNDALACCAAILTHHDYQLRTAPLAVLDSAYQRLDRLVSGQSYGLVHPICGRRK